jgi:hypothetical protein
MSEQTLALVEQIRLRLRKTGRRIVLADLVAGALAAVALILGLTALVVSLEAGFWLSPVYRVATVVLAAIGSVAFLLAFCGRPLLRLYRALRRPDDLDVARRVGAHYPVVEDRLVNLLNLSDGRSSAAAGPMVEGAIRHLITQIGDVEFDAVERFARARKNSRLAAIPVGLILVILFAAPGPFLGAGGRLLAPTTPFERPPPFAFTVEPGDVELVRGETLAITGRVSGRYLPVRVVLEYQHPDEEKLETIDIEPATGGGFGHELVNLRKDIRYRVRAESVQSSWFTATITDRPIVRGLHLELTPPSYTALPSRRLDPNVGDVLALQGTRVNVRIGLGTSDVSQAMLVFDDETTTELEINGDSATGEFVLRRDGTYRVLLFNEDGLTNTGQVDYSMRATRDEPPSARIIQPEPTLNLDPTLRTDVLVHITDDFGFSRLRIYYRLAESRFGTTSEEFLPIDIPLAQPRLLDQDVFFDWNVRADSRLDLVPGDVVEYFAAVRDNDTVARYKEARSNVHRLRVPTAAERFQEMERRQDEATTAMDNLMQDSRNIRRQFDELRDAVRRRQQGEWEDQRQAQSIENRQENLEQRIEDLASTVDEISRELARNEMVSPETIERYQELRRVIEEINDPALRQAMEQLREAMQQLDLQKTQEALQNFEFSERDFRERLERAVELFKRLRAEQGFEEASRRAEEIARQLEELREQTSDAGANNQEMRENLAQQQQRAGQDTQSLMEQLENLQRQLEEMRGSAPREDLKALTEELQRDRVAEQMQEAARNIEQGRMDQASQQQEQSGQQMQQAAQRLQEMQQSMQSGQTQINVAALRMALENVLRLSFSQEQLTKRTQDLSAQSNQLRALATDQAALRDVLSTVSDSLQSIARQLPDMRREVQTRAGMANREMGRATEALTDRIAPQAASHQQASMTHLNELARMLADLLSQLQNQQGGEGGGMSAQQMLEQLQQMSGQQQALNEQIQQMLNDMQGERLAQDAGERMQQIASQQEAIKRQLEQLARDPGARREGLNALERLADQMDQTIRDLRNNQLTRPVVERQNEILNRLLEAQRSLQQRDEDERRESRRGEPVPRDVRPTGQPADSQFERLRRDLLRALESGYAPDYEDLIKRYFELLRRLEE